MLEVRDTQQGKIPLWNGVALEQPHLPVYGAHVFAQKHPPDTSRLYVLFGAGGDYRVKAICDALEEMGVKKNGVAVYEPRKEILEAFPRDPRAQYFTDLPSLVTYCSGHPGRDMEFVAPQEYMEAFPEEFAPMEGALREAEQSRRVRRNTYLFRGTRALKNVILNRAILAEALPAPLLGAVVNNGTAFCVAAGSSLDLNGHLLGECRKKGFLFTASTVGKAVVDHWDQDIDFHVTIENVSQDYQIRWVRNRVHTILLDLTANPDNFAAAMTGRTAYFIAPVAGADFVWRNVRAPIIVPYGASVATAMPPLALRLGAKRIVLIGSDFAFPGGRMYAQGCGRDDHHVTDEGGYFKVHRPPEFFEHFKKAGIPMPADRIDYEITPGWGGGEDVKTPVDLKLFMQNFEMFAAQHAGLGVELINASEAGAHLKGWEDRPLADVLGDCDDRDAGALDRAWERAPKDGYVNSAKIEKVVAAVRKATVGLREGCRRAAKVKDFVQRGQAVENLYKRWVQPHPLLDALVGPSISRVYEYDHVPPEEKPYWIARAVEETCTELLEEVL